MARQEDRPDTDAATAGRAPTADPAEPIDVRVRARLRELRAEQGLTLAQVAERAALDVSTLSRLESGKRRLSLDHLRVLAGALGVTVDQLLSAPVVPDPWVRGRSQRRHGLTARPLTRRGHAGLQAYRVTVDAARREPPQPLPVHEGYDTIHVLAGRMRLMLGPEDLVVAPGETVEFSTWTPHWFGVVDEPVELILIIGPGGAQEHLER